MDFKWYSNLPGHERATFTNNATDFGGCSISPLRGKRFLQQMEFNAAKNTACCVLKEHPKSALKDRFNFSRITLTGYPYFPELLWAQS